MQSLHCLSSQEAMDFTNPRDSPVGFTCVSIGLRRREVMGLRWCDLDLEHDLLRIQQNLTTPGGKLEMRPTKTVSGT